MSIETLFNLGVAYAIFVFVGQVVVFAMAVAFFVFFIKEWRKMK